MKETKFGTAGCVIRNNKVLLLHRIENHDIWEFPGGGIEFGESPEEAAVREVKEESNLTVKSKGLLTINSHLISKNTHHIWFYYVCEVLEEEAKIGDKSHSEFKWFNLDEIKKIPNLALNVKYILPELQKILSD